MPKLSALRKRVLEISAKYGLSHVGSSLSAVDILDEIYPLGEVVVSSGHAGVAWYVVIERHLGGDAEEMFKECGVHCQMYGSLGHGIGVAAGKALANRRKQVYCLMSDGECMEGSVIEALRLAQELKLKNLNVIINANGYGGLKKMNLDYIYQLFYLFDLNLEVRKTNTYPLKGLQAHYEKVV